MKIFILRHEDRTQDCTFFSPLTEKGLNNAQILVKALKENNINMIFSSPFIRTLQTVYPFLKETNKKVNIEYALSEIHHPDIIPSKSVGLVLPEYLAKQYNYNPDYQTLIKSTQIKYPENIKYLENRMKRFIKNIIEKYYKTDLNILIVTHQSLCNTMIKVVNNFSIEYKNKLNNEIETGYEKGKVCLIYNNDWTYKKIN